MRCGVARVVLEESTVYVWERHKFLGSEAATDAALVVENLKQMAEAPFQLVGSELFDEAVKLFVVKQPGILGIETEHYTDAEHIQ